MKNTVLSPLRYFKYTLMTIFALSFVNTSCDGIEQQLQPVVDFVEDITEIGEGLEDAMTLAEDAITITQADGSTGYLVGECAVVTNDAANNVLTIDMGNANCVGLNNVARSGKITINYIDDNDPDAYSYSIDFSNYKIGGNTIEGKLTLNKIHRNSDGKLEFSEKVENAKITLSNGNYYTWNSERVREMVNGEGTPSVKDDVFVINGFFEGQDQNGKVFSTKIEQPITFFRECWDKGVVYPSLGQTKVKMTGNPTTTINWGIGCNKRVNILQNNNWLNIELD